MAVALSVRVAEADTVADDVRVLTLTPEPGTVLPAFSPGSHVVVHVPNGPRPRRNPYSLASEPWRTDAYRIAVRRIEGGRGSVAMHEDVQAGDVLTIETPQNFFAPPATACRHVLVAGGIGITPFVSYVHALLRTGTDFELHHAFRDAAAAPLVDELQALCGLRLTTWEDPDGAALMAYLRERVLPEQPLGTHLSVCGPAPMMDAVTAAAYQLGWPSTRVHLERFAADTGPMDPFTVRLARSGLDLAVPEGVTLLDALEDAGAAPPSLCRLGFCGECRTGLVGGTADHRDAFLDPSERATAVMPCVSRCSSGPLVLDL
ncbi:MAG: oxidoreductase [Solirubrobacteraceae bacterium]|nr:oxidoreductase [Solirubrobacteraceae bacterium]